MTGLVLAVISALWLLFYINVLDTGMIDKVLTKQEIEMEERGMSNAEIEQAMGYTEMFMNPPMMAAMAIFFFMFLSLIISLIAAAILKKDPPPAYTGETNIR